ncbi:very-long-chain (3R)-3-hydroxyacyl-CoA dehydratase [Silurus asotus]|uniref:Very-long-chain (3R)-3-hydroxyacyl-CoA dehydratase n=1 Tax=Silurus asotus TaxID=30991 RepID=A0AAD5A103_SILAS|nr:very-long-chain (3R)-3-hydroxyacyl-CoA dehydratase [Silurus asotus]
MAAAKRQKQCSAALYNAFSTCAPVLYGCQMLAVLEVMGRNVILFVVFGSLPEMQERSVVFWVFYLWSISEVFRLAFPVLKLDAKFRMLICLRHALLYPLTTLTEGEEDRLDSDL